MDLFGPDPAANLLPRDGEAYYHGPVFDDVSRTGLMVHLLSETPWQNDEVRMFGKIVVTARKVAWFADGGVSYSYSGTTKAAHGWSDPLLEIRRTVEGLTGAEYNSCLLNLYHDGNEGMGWHSDDEKTLVPASSIASVSFGVERRFSFKHRETGETVSINLESGSLLDMRGPTQRNWLHQLPKTKKVSDPRINLTFRRMIF